MTAGAANSIPRERAMAPIDDATPDLDTGLLPAEHHPH